MNCSDTILRQQAKKYKVEAIVAWCASFFMMLFAVWTIAHHAATFMGIPWEILSLGIAMSSIPLIGLTAWGAYHFACSYVKETRYVEYPTVLKDKVLLGLFIIVAALLLVTSTYSLRLIIVALSFLILYWRVRNQCAPLPANTGNENCQIVHNANSSYVILVILVFIAVTITLMAYRSDFDDAEYIQMAAQTLRFPNRAPLTFDTSLGFMLESFRFAPYRIDSYETLVAFITTWTGFDLLTVYYILLPALSAALTIGVAFLFVRWFLPHKQAVLATGIFLLIILAWGESHVAYGNRVFVRLYQGKELLIALTTPMTLIAGLLLLRQLSIWHWMFLVLIQIATIGVSSTGLVLAFITTALVLVMAVKRDVKATVLALMAVASTLFYPAMIGAWLTFSSSAVSSINKIGTYLPINASLGLNVREACALLALTFGATAFKKGKPIKEYALLTGATIFIVLNPLISELLADHSARTMSWRLAWAAPVPLLMSIAFTAAITPLFSKQYKNKKHLIVPFFALSLLVLFLGTARWTTMASNDVTWHFPSAKVPAEYHMAKEISEVINKNALNGTILAGHRIGTWLTVVAPNLKLVMPGHGYLIALKTILPPSDFEGRMRLLGALGGEVEDQTGITELLRLYKVSTVVIPKGLQTKKFIEYLHSRTDIIVREIYPAGGHRIFLISYGEEKQKRGQFEGTGKSRQGVEVASLQQGKG